jgi:hypothetical protein
MTDRGMNTLTARGVEEQRVNLLSKENSFMSNIIHHRSLILELKFYKLYVLICIMFSIAMLKGHLYTIYFTKYYYSNNS